MAMVHDETRMLRKQYHISVRQVQRLEALRTELGVNSEAEVIRRAIDAFDPDVLDPEERELIETTAEQLRQQVADLSNRLDETIGRVQAARQQVSDPDWVEGIQARTRREAEDDPALLSGVARLVGA